ncbi:MAG: hypothetical protein M1812_006475 [Candelaria pacifica]|nr:MAG: hypothetical protein M1812_006475 [Candelaria pacifica]
MSSLTASNLFNVNGLVAVITGGGTGIGLMIAKALAQNGASKVYIIGRRQDRLDAAVLEASINNNVIPLIGDVTSKASLQKLASQITRETGYINVLIANSGISGPSVKALNPEASVQEVQEYLWAPSMEEFNETYEVNTTGVFYTTIAFLDLLDRGNKQGNVQQQSQVIATSSIGGFSRVPAAGFAYGSSKAGVVHMMKQLSTRFSGFGIRANVLAPGCKLSHLPPASSSPCRNAVK